MITSSDGAAPARDAAARRARRWVWIAVAVAVGWFVVGGAVGPFAGKLSSVQENDAATFLPSSAESTLAADEQQRFAEVQAVPALVVFSADRALTAADRQAVDRFVDAVPSLALPDGRTVADYLVPGAITPIPSQDGRALLVAVPLDGDAVATPMADGKSPLLRVVEALRPAAAQVPGLASHVTGPAGILADLVSAFGGIDTTLLGATALVVALILVLVYRSPFVWIVPLVGAGFSLALASAVVYALAKADVVTLNGQSQGILTVLVFGAGTDYALLLVSRYREELHHHDDHVEAMRAAWRGVVEPIAASAATVTIGLMCLLLSQLNSNKSTGPVAAVGIAAALVVMLTFLPALLVVPSAVVALLVAGALFAVLAVAHVPAAAAGAAAVAATVALFVVGARARAAASPPAWAFFARWPAGRWAFWPKVPRNDDRDEKLSGVWSRVAGTVGRRPRAIWVSATAALLVLAGFTATLQASGISTTDSFVDETDSVLGQRVLAEHFPGGAGSPTTVFVEASTLAPVLAAVTGTPGVAAAYPVPATGTGASGGASGSAEPKVVDGRVQLQVVLSDPADSEAAQATVVALRGRVHAVPGSQALVGGTTAVAVDTQDASRHDRNLIIPVVLAVILVVLALLLRSLLAPVLLVATVLLSFFATLGVCALVFDHVLQFPGADTSFPLFAFTFLVALGIDYNIFLMTRVREESVRAGTRPGILLGLTVTGGVITSAGIVLAATFAVLGVLPLVFLREVGFAVAFGVLLDTLVVRSLLVPALSYDIGRRIWWPSALGRADGGAAAGGAPGGQSREPAPAGPVEG